MNNLYKEMVRKPGDLCFEVSLESDKGLTMTDLSFALKFFVYGHPKNVCIHKDDLKVVEGKYYAVLNEHGFVNGVLFCEAEIVETINGINRIVSVRSNTGYMIGNCCQPSVDTSSCAHGYSLSLYKVEYVPQPIDPNPEEDQLVAEELFGEKLSLPELTADRAIADEHGNRIADTYETRQAVRNHIREVYNEQFIENPPLILDEYITPQMLSEGVKDMLSQAGATINNVPDGEDLTTKQGVLKLSDKPYNPGAYSGLGRIYLRKNLVGGQNLLTQAMVSKTNTIYILQYDYTLDGKSITIPEGCVLSYEGGSIRDGHINYTDTLIKGIVSLNNVVETGNVKYYPLRADEEDLTTEGGKYFKFADKQYDPSNHSGLGRIYLRKNMVEGKNILTQEMISKPNTIYIIQYDYDLNSAEITIPEGCILNFEGGSIKKGKVNFNGSQIIAGDIRIFNNITFGSVPSGRLNVCWVGASFRDTQDNASYFNEAFSTGMDIYIPKGTFRVNNTVTVKSSIFCEGRIYSEPSTVETVIFDVVDNGFSSNSSKKLIIDGLHITEVGTKWTATAIDVQRTDTTIQNCYVLAFKFGVRLRTFCNYLTNSTIRTCINNIDVSASHNTRQTCNVAIIGCVSAHAKDLSLSIGVFRPSIEGAGDYYSGFGILVSGCSFDEGTLEIEKVHTVGIRDCYFEKATSRDVAISINETSQLAHNITIDDCTFINFKYGIKVWLNCPYLNIGKCNFKAIRRYAIALRMSSGNSPINIESCRFESDVVRDVLYSYYNWGNPYRYMALINFSYDAWYMKKGFQTIPVLGGKFPINFNSIVLNSDDSNNKIISSPALSYGNTYANPSLVDAPITATSTNIFTFANDIDYVKLNINDILLVNNSYVIVIDLDLDTNTATIMNIGGAVIEKGKSYTVSQKEVSMKFFQQIGAGQSRPSSVPEGYQYFDKTLSKPIWFVNSKWVDATGAEV